MSNGSEAQEIALELVAVEKARLLADAIVGEIETSDDAARWDAIFAAALADPGKA